MSFTTGRTRHVDEVHQGPRVDDSRAFPCSGACSDATQLIAATGPAAGLSRVRCVGLELMAAPASGRKFNTQRYPIMLWTILVIVLVLWLLGLIGSVGGGLIHLLLLVAAVILVVQLLSGRRTV